MSDETTQDQRDPNQVWFEISKGTSWQEDPVSTRVDMHVRVDHLVSKEEIAGLLSGLVMDVLDVY